MKCKFCNNWTCTSRTTDGNRECIYEEPGEKMQTLQIFDNIHWQSFRAEAAKDILCATLSGGTAYGMNDAVSKKETIVKASIEIADELIKQLK